jgi:hypothetical protein
MLYAGFNPFPGEPEWCIEIEAGPILLILSCSADGMSSANLWIGSLDIGYSAYCEGPSGRNCFCFSIGSWGFESEDPD